MEALDGWKSVFMKKALIISYYFPPYSGIEGNRCASWAKEFSKHGIFPVVVTRHWNLIPQEWKDYFKEDLRKAEITFNDNNRIIRLPYKLRPSFKIIKGTKNKFLSFGLYWVNKLVGNFHIETGANFSFKGALIELLKVEKFDMIIVTAPPVNIIKLGRALSKKFKIPLICDFRDLYDNDILKKGYKPKFGMRINNSLFRYYLKRWLKKASLVTSVCWPMTEILSRFSKGKTDVVYNGYEEDLFDQLSGAEKNEKFTVSLVGNLYPKQDLDFMIDALKLFITGKTEQEVQINFIGIKNNKEVSDKISALLPASFINVTHRIQREEALQFIKSADVLYYIGWPQYKGLFSGKIFEYLGARRNILIAPSDHDALENLIKETKAGKTADTVEQMAEYLNQWFEEWKKNGMLSYYGDESKIRQFTREEQARKFAEIIKQTLF